MEELQDNPLPQIYESKAVLQRGAAVRWLTPAGNERKCT